MRSGGGNRRARSSRGRGGMADLHALMLGAPRPPGQRIIQPGPDGQSARLPECGAGLVDTCVQMVLVRMPAWAGAGYRGLTPGAAGGCWELVMASKVSSVRAEQGRLARAMREDGRSWRQVADEFVRR